MSEIQEPELLPCPFCGGKVQYIRAAKSNGIRTDWICCPDCHFYTDMRFFRNEREFLEVWNLRFPAAGQWTTEPPKESGIYIAKRIRGVAQDKHRIFDYSDHTDKEVAEIRQNLSEFYPDALWLKLDIPPLPEEKESEQ